MSVPRSEMLELVKAAHATQFRNNGRVPYWMHLQAVAEIIEWAFTGTDEVCDSALRDDLYVAALGHDLYEDTDVRREDVSARFGPRVDAWIQGMKNDGDDEDRAAYLARIAVGPEEVRLIKLADLTENMASCAYAIPDMGIEWTRAFFLPIATETSSMLGEATFTGYPRTAERLRGQMDFQLGHLRRNVAMYLSTKSSAVDERFARVDAENAAALAKAEAEAHASGKEPFSLSRLEEIYEPNLADREASLRMRYYVRLTELRTLAELVEHLREHEIWG